jgi:hypothetical protein
MPPGTTLNRISSIYARVSSAFSHPSGCISFTWLLTQHCYQSMYQTSFASLHMMRWASPALSITCLISRTVHIYCASWISLYSRAGTELQHEVIWAAAEAIVRCTVPNAAGSSSKVKVNVNGPLKGQLFLAWWQMRQTTADI